MSSSAIEPFVTTFEQFDRAGSNAPFAALRHEARARLRDLAWPSSKTEDWRFTDVGSRLQGAFQSPAGAPAADLDLPPPADAQSLRLVFVDGVYRRELSTTGALPGGAQILPLSEARPEDLHAHLGQVASFRDHPFTALNTGLLRDGACILVPAGVQLDRPVELVFVAAAAQPQLLIAPRVLVVVGGGGAATLVERYLARGAEHYFTNAVVEMTLDANAQLDHVKLQDESRQALHVANMQVALAQGSRFTTHYVSFGGSLVRNEVRVRFDGSGAEATVNGLYLAQGTQHIDNFTVIDHAVPHCNSHELYKGILTDQAHGVFNGKIFVRQDAQKTDAKQTNKVLLLSESATINTKPQLEIYADDVKCTHGATVGQLDPDQLFYLQARGVPQAAARSLLTFAFANDIVTRLPLAALRDELEQRIVQQHLL